MNRAELEKVGEEGTEKGGYFVCKGSEKVILLEKLKNINKVLFGKYSIWSIKGKYLVYLEIFCLGDSNVDRQQTELSDRLGQAEVQNKGKDFRCQ